MTEYESQPPHNRSFNPGGQREERGGGGQYGGGHGGGPQERLLTEIWPGYLRDGYFDAKRNIKPDFLRKDKVEPLVKAMTKGFPPLTMHQVRRYFQHCRSIEARLKSQETNWDREQAEVLRLNMAAAYAFGKKEQKEQRERKIPRLFHDFIEMNVNAIRNEEDFLRGFLPHFEALVGFGTAYLRDERGR